MTKVQAKQAADRALEQLAEALEQGKSETLVTYLDTLAKFHHYSFGNVLLISQQKPAATRVAGFHTWKKFGRHVRQGEHGITILAPMTYQKKTDTDDEEAEAEMIRGFKAVTVFDISQTDGSPLSAFARVKGQPKEHLDRLQAFAADRGIAITFDDIKGGADGFSTGGTVTVRIDLNDAEKFSVLTHEIAHELLHKADDRKQLAKTTVETEAEAVAYTVSRAIGLDTNTAASDYIQLYHGDRRTLSASLNRIQKVAAEIIAQVAA